MKTRPDTLQPNWEKEREELTELAEKIYELKEQWFEVEVLLKNQEANWELVKMLNQEQQKN
jgi:hypothetical protein